MDCFIKITPQKNTENKITIHKREFKILQEHIKSNTNVIICGNVGSGKTHFLDCILNDRNSIEITHENISNKNDQSNKDNLIEYLIKENSEFRLITATLQTLMPT